MYKIKINPLKNNNYRFVEYDNHVDIMFNKNRGLRIYFNKNKRVLKFELLYVIKKFNGDSVLFPVKEFDFDDLQYDEELKNDLAFSDIKTVLKLCVK